MNEPQQDRRFATTLARGLNILRVFRPADDGLSNLEISERTGLPRSTVSRLTFTLCALGYLTHGRHFDRYRLGPAALALGNIAAAGFGFVTVAAPLMQALANRLSTLVGVSLQDDGEMLIVKTWRPEVSSTRWLDEGYRMPILRSSSGLAHLGALTSQERAQLETCLPAADASQCHGLWQVQRAALAQRGFACVDQLSRYAQAINAVAVPFRAPEIAAPVAFFCGANAATRSDAFMRQEAGPALVQAVERLRQLVEQTGTDESSD